MLEEEWPLHTEKNRYHPLPPLVHPPTKDDVDTDFEMQELEKAARESQGLVNENYQDIQTVTTATATLIDIEQDPQQEEFREEVNSMRSSDTFDSDGYFEDDYIDLDATTKYPDEVDNDITFQV